MSDERFEQAQKELAKAMIESGRVDPEMAEAVAFLTVSFFANVARIASALQTISQPIIDGVEVGDGLHG